jgi:uncharacterized protein YcbX
MATVSELAIYPVKSCGVLHPEQAELDARGFRDDRRWMIVRDTPNAASSSPCANTRRWR